MVEGGGLESRCSACATPGSNPGLSAILLRAFPGVIWPEFEPPEASITRLAASGFTVEPVAVENLRVRRRVQIRVGLRTRNMARKLLKGCGIFVLLAAFLCCAGMAWIFHAHKPHFPWPSPRSTIDEATWKKAAAEPAKTETRLKVLTWNVQFLPAFLAAFSEHLQKLQSERAPWIAEYLNGLDYDVICFQEAFDNKAVAALIDGLKQKYPYVVFPQYASQWRALSNGVLFMSRAPIRYVDHVTYPGLSRIEWWTSKGCCLIEGIKDGIRFQMAGTHFPTGRQSGKDASVAAICSRILPHREAGVAFIALGDFNTRKGSPEYEELLKALNVRDFPIDDPRPFTSDPENTWKKGRARGPSLIDHVLLDPNGSGTEFARRFVQRATHEYQGAKMDLSDHYGLAAEIVLKP